MSNLYWLASYPKSGNTWLRALLTNYLSDDKEPADINKLLSGGAFDIEILDDYLGLESSDLTEKQIHYYRPLVYKEMARENSEPLFLKVHDANIKNSKSLPIFPRDATGGVFYMIRNPLEVAVSYAHHRDKSIDKTIASMDDDKHSLGGWRGNHGQVPQRLQSWSNHVKSWVDESDLPTHLVRYEDLLEDTVGVFTDIVKFSGLEVDEERLKKAVEFSSFEKLQNQERETGFAEKQPSAKSFFRKGRSDSWRARLTDRQVMQIISDHRDVMERFGYLDDLDSAY